jgi:thymidylate synthase (FAD)
MGNDDSIVKAARISYNADDYKEDPVKTRHLIRYLMRNSHTTPFEMVDFKFHVKAPIYVARQWLRHRTASVNEVSARYTHVTDEYYLPTVLRKQSKINHQGSDPSDLFSSEENNELVGLLDESCETSFSVYNKLIEMGVAKELARSCLPMNTMTEFYWKINLHNLLHFLKLRMDDHAQHEIVCLANNIYDLIQPIVPITCEAFKDYHVNSMTLSGPEIIAMRTGDTSKLSSRELTEFREKWSKISNEDYKETTQ